MKNVETVSNVVTVNTQALEQILNNIELPKGVNTFAYITQLTSPKILKKDRVTKVVHNFINVQKQSSLSIQLNTDYEKFVGNQLEREDKANSEYKRGFNTMPLDKSESSNNFFGTFKGNSAIEYKPTATAIPTKPLYFANGNPIEKEALGDILPTVSKATNQGTDKEIVWRKLYVKNILEITIQGTKYKVVN